MTNTIFADYAADERNPLYEEYIRRESPLYSRTDDIRSPFARDYTRILHSQAYRRLKHKTQVFYNIDNDHICTRIEHVSHVESVSSSIAKYLGLNDELTKAIATGHDLGHAPFGHQGEYVLSELSEKYLSRPFWHERNGLRFVDDIELLEDNYKKDTNLNLTYAVRDGIISHCGEIDENCLKPRKELINLDTFMRAGEYMPSTWEGCIVKLSDKIAYLGRDIEDAQKLGFLGPDEMKILDAIAAKEPEGVINTTVIMHKLIIDICHNSNPDDGIRMSDRYFEQICAVKDFNIKYIYNNPKFSAYLKYSRLVINELFDTLMLAYDGCNSLEKLKAKGEEFGGLYRLFRDYVIKYVDPSALPASEKTSHENKKIYGDLSTKEKYTEAVIDYISGMTDAFAVDSFNSLLTF